MRKIVLCSLVLLVALNAFGHAGEVHKYMGTVASVNGDGTFVLKKTDGTSLRVEVSSRTAFVFANGSAAPRAELAAGKRVVVTISTDGRTASEIKFAAKKS
ncbi:MAG TPA: hypothetical protein VHK90_13835 [Thermoanaerobaculia bacterium]|nr:hypothetical protein [Thermoanaerobaculia bacterium]